MRGEEVLVAMRRAVTATRVGGEQGEEEEEMKEGASAHAGAVLAMQPLGEHRQSVVVVPGMEPVAARQATGFCGSAPRF